MQFSKMSQLSASSWVKSSDSLITSYRAFSKDGTVASKGKLALSATIDAVKAIAYTILSAFGLVFHAITFGQWPNKPWSYACLHTQMSASALYAIFKFKPAMEQFRIVEARALCRSLMLGEEDDKTLYLTSKKLTSSEIAQNAFTKFKGLNVHQLADAIKIPYDNSAKYLETLYRIAAAVSASERIVIYNKIETIQKKIYDAQTDKMLTFSYVSPDHSKSFVAFCPLNQRQILETMWPELKTQIDKVEKSKGAERLQVTEQQCLLAGYISTSVDSNPIFLLGTERMPSAEELYRLNHLRQKTWNLPSGIEADASRISYLRLIKEAKEGKLEVQMQKGTLSISKAIDIMRQYFKHRPTCCSKEKEHLPSTLIEHCTKYLLDNVGHPEMMNISKDDTAMLIDTVEPLPFLIACLSKGNINMLKALANKHAVYDKPADVQILHAWEKADSKMRLEAMPHLFSLSCRSEYWDPSTKKYIETFPKLANAIITLAKDPASIMAAPAACEETLRLNVKVNDKDGTVEALRFALAHNMDALRDSCVDNILKNAHEDSAAWLGGEPLLAQALHVTKRAPKDSCVAEGVALAKFAKGNSDATLRDACKQYVKKHPAYRDEVMGYPVEKRKFYQDVLDMYN